MVMVLEVKRVVRWVLRRIGSGGREGESRVVYAEESWFVMA